MTTSCSNRSAIVLVMSFAVFAASGCGAVEQAQEAARQDYERSGQAAADRAKALETIGHAYFNFAKKHNHGPKDLDELIGYVEELGSSEEAIAALRRTFDSGRYTVIWGVDIGAWRKEQAALHEYILGWYEETPKSGGPVILGHGGVKNVTLEQFKSMPQLTVVPDGDVIKQQISSGHPAANPAVAATDLNSAIPANPPIQPNAVPANPNPTPSTTPNPAGNPAPSTVPSSLPTQTTVTIFGPQTSVADLLTALKSNDSQTRRLGMSHLVGWSKPIPNEQVSKAVLATIRTSDLGIQMLGLAALEKWGTPSTAKDLRQLAGPTANPGFRFQASRVIQILEKKKP